MRLSSQLMLTTCVKPSKNAYDNNLFAITCFSERWILLCSFVLVLQLGLTAWVTGLKPAFGLHFLSLNSHLPCLMCSSLLLCPPLEVSIPRGIRDSLGCACLKSKPRIMRIAFLTVYNVNLILNPGQLGYNFFVLGSCFSPWTKLPGRGKAEWMPVQHLSIRAWPLWSPRGSHTVPARNGDVPLCHAAWGGATGRNALPKALPSILWLESKKKNHILAINYKW